MDGRLDLLIIRLSFNSGYRRCLNTGIIIGTAKRRLEGEMAF